MKGEKGGISLFINNSYDMSVTPLWMQMSSVLLFDTKNVIFGWKLAYEFGWNWIELYCR